MFEEPGGGQGLEHHGDGEEIRSSPLSALKSRYRCSRMVSPGELT
jgi:hypothetical protein